MKEKIANKNIKRKSTKPRKRKKHECELNKNKGNSH